MSKDVSPLPSGAIAPNFTLAATAQASVSLHALRGRPVVLIFYLHDWESVSREELIAFQEFGYAFVRANGRLLGISTDTISSHETFARAARIRFPLLSDSLPKGVVSRMYGVFRESEGVSMRALIVIDSRGIVRFSRIYPDALNPGVDDPLTIVEALAAEEANRRDSETSRPFQRNSDSDKEEQRWSKEA